MEDITINSILEAFEIELKKKFPCGVPLIKIEEATGGILTSRTMTNKDCLKCGIPGRFKLGRRTIYPVNGVIQYLREKMSTGEAV